MDLTEAFAPIDTATIQHGRTPGEASDGWRAVMPVPADAPDIGEGLLTSVAPAGHAFAARWRYNDAAGRLLGYVARYDCLADGGPAGKQVKPFTWCEGPGRKREWRCKGFPDPRPLYGLDRLASRPQAPVLLAEGEKAADAAARLFPDHVTIASPGGSKAAGKADWTALKGRRVAIWPDADDPGTAYADDAAELLRKAGAAWVRLVRLPPGLPKGWDLADHPPAGMNAAALSRYLTEAGPTGEDPIPLFPPLPEPDPFPVDALGPVLERAAGAIARKVQAPEAIAAQSVLAAAALAAQAHADVMLPYGQTRPLSLFFVTVAASGDRKSTADNEALWPIRRHEKALKEKHEAEHREWMIAAAAWNAQKKKVEGDGKTNYAGKRDAIAALGPEPERPLHPFLTMPDPTIEGLLKAWVHAPAALGLFTAEGGQFIGGHGMSQDHRLKTAAIFSEIWDGKPINRIRAGEGVTMLDGRRLSLHLMVQQDAAAGFLADPLLRDQGLLSRVLVAAPSSIAGTRLYRDTDPGDDAAIRAYGARLLAILETAWPLARDKRNELEPRALRITAGAERLWKAFYDHVETQCGSSGGLAPIRDFAAKTAEHAARIAGVLEIVGNIAAIEIGEETMRCAIRLVDWYLNEALRLQQGARTDPRLLRAKKLLEWLQGRGANAVDFRDIIQRGPNAIRTKAAADDALAILADHGWIAEVSRRPRRVRLAEGARAA